MITGNELNYVYRNSAVGIDGVRESGSGSRSLIVVSLMLSGCIMCWKIINYLQKTPNAKPSMEELLRQVTVVYFSPLQISVNYA